MTERKKIALITYNLVGDGKYPQVNKGEENDVYIAQGNSIAAVKEQWRTDSDAQKIRADASKNAVQTINLEDMDKVYVYVGEKGGEEMIRQTLQVPTEKIVYVMCGHNSDAKNHLIYQYRGGYFSQKIICECGGRATLERILQDSLR